MSPYEYLNVKKCFTGLKKEFEEQLKEEKELNERIIENLKKIKLEDIKSG